MFSRLIIFEIIWWPDDFQNVKAGVLCWPITDKSVSRRWELPKAQERRTEVEAKVVANRKPVDGLMFYTNEKVVRL